jgi:hypothetical protein
MLFAVAFFEKFVICRRSGAVSLREKIVHVMLVEGQGWSEICRAVNPNICFSILKVHVVWNSSFPSIIQEY